MSKPEEKEHRSYINRKIKKRLTIFLGRSMETSGWIGFFYYWFESPVAPDYLGMAFTLFLIFAGIMVDVLIYEG